MDEIEASAEDNRQLSSEEAAAFLREHGYERMTAVTVGYMHAKVIWGPPELTVSGLRKWLKREDELGEERERIEKEEERQQSLRKRPIWAILTRADVDPAAASCRDKIEAYDCDVVRIDDIDAFHEYVDAAKPDAAVVAAYAYDAVEISRTITDLVRRGIYCVLLGHLPTWALADDVRAKCSFYEGCAYGSDRSVFAGAPSQLALRMNLRKGLAYERKVRLSEIRDAAWNGYGWPL